MTDDADGPGTVALYEEADLYAAAFDWPVEDEVDWAMSLVPGARVVLEPMCGSARFGPAFVHRGAAYWGIDRSEAMLARAPRLPGMHLVAADARRFELPGVTAQLAWCPVNSIRYLVEREAMRDHLRAVRSHLDEAGAYVVETDLVRRDGVIEASPPERSRWSVPQPDGTVIEAAWRAARADLASRVIHEEGFVRRLRDGAVIAEARVSDPMRMLTVDEWREDVAAAGLVIDRVFWHGPGETRPTVALSNQLENDGENYYFVLRPAGPVPADASPGS